MKKTLLLCAGLAAAATLVFAGYFDLPQAIGAAALHVPDWGPVLLFSLAAASVLASFSWPLLAAGMVAVFRFCQRLARDLAMQVRQADARVAVRSSGYGPVWA